MQIAKEPLYTICEQQGGTGGLAGQAGEQGKAHSERCSDRTQRQVRVPTAKS